MNIRRVITSGSVWLFDMDRMQYVRFPRNEAPPSGGIPYSCQWEPFEKIEPYGDNQLMVHRPVEWGTGARRHTGTILEDSEENHDA